MKNRGDIKMDMLTTARPGQEAALVQSGKGRVVLVADDHEGCRESLSRLLEAFGFEVLRAKDGGEAMMRMSRQKPDLIFLDMMMPVMNGWEVLHQLQEDSKLSKIPVVVLSGVADLEGMDGEEIPVVFLQKPADPATLLHLLEHYCPCEAV